jgi:hypothetical protein
MTVEDWVKLLLGAGGALAIVQWLSRRSDQKWKLAVDAGFKDRELKATTKATETIEKAKGEIRRDVEKDLKSHEAMMRTDAEKAIEGVRAQIRLDVEKELKTHESALRSRAETSLERLKGEIRRDVEENLKTHESHLRIQAELRLRAHERSWGLLRDFTAGAWKLRESLVDYAVAAMGHYPNQSTAYDRAGAAQRELRALSATLPPESGDIRPVLTMFQEVFRECNRLAVDDEDSPIGPDRGRVTDAIKARIDHAVVLAEVIAIGWNKALWSNSSTVPSE